jgi:hypothetical protein
MIIIEKLGFNKKELEAVINLYTSLRAAVQCYLRDELGIVHPDIFDVWIEEDLVCADYYDTPDETPIHCYVVQIPIKKIKNKALAIYSRRSLLEQKNDER